MPSRHKKLHITPDNIPRLLLLTDMRNDAILENAIDLLPTGSGIIFRHYHLDNEARRRRFDQIAEQAERHGHVLILSGNANFAENWNADGIYGAPQNLENDSALMQLATVHNDRELAMASDMKADAVLISPVFSTCSHSDSKFLSVDGFCALAKKANCPAIALGGMTADNFRLIPKGVAHGWAAIDGLSDISEKHLTK